MEHVEKPRGKGRPLHVCVYVCACMWTRKKREMRDTAIIRRERSARTGPDGIEFKLNRIYLRITVSLPLFSLTTRISFAILAIFGTFPISHLQYIITYIFSRLRSVINLSLKVVRNPATLPT